MDEQDLAWAGTEAYLNDLLESAEEKARLFPRKKARIPCGKSGENEVVDWSAQREAYRSGLLLGAEIREGLHRVSTGECCSEALDEKVFVVGDRDGPRRADRYAAALRSLIPPPRPATFFRNVAGRRNKREVAIVGGGEGALEDLTFLGLRAIAKEMPAGQRGIGAGGGPRSSIRSVFADAEKLGTG